MANAKSNGTVTVQAAAELEALKAQIEKLRAENESLKSSSGANGLPMKVTEKGGLSVYGLGRFPVTLYKSQWIKLIANISAVEEFIKVNDRRLTVKE